MTCLRVRQQRQAAASLIQSWFFFCIVAIMAYPTHAMIQQSLDDLDLRPPSRGRGVEPPPDYMVFGISIGLAFSWLLVSWLATTASGQRSEVCQSFSLPATCLMDFRQPDNPPAPTASDNTGTTTAEADQPAQVFCSTILCDTSQF